MAAQAYTPEIDPKDPPQGRQRLFQTTTLTGCGGTPWEALHTALYWAQGSLNGPDTPEPTEAWVMQAKAMRNYRLHHPFERQPGCTAMAFRSRGDRAQARRPHAQPRESEHANACGTPTKRSGPASNTPLLQTPLPPSPATCSPTQASETKKGRTRPRPSRKSSDVPTPRTPPDPPGKPGPSILVVLAPLITTA